MSTGILAQGMGLGWRHKGILDGLPKDLNLALRTAWSLNASVSTEVDIQKGLSSGLIQTKSFRVFLFASVEGLLARGKHLQILDFCPAVFECHATG